MVRNHLDAFMIDGIVRADGGTVTERAPETVAGLGPAT
jgi:hypothetical protein